MKWLRNFLFLLLAAAAGSACAQTKPGDVVATVPFDFVVDGQRLPAGRYIVSPEGAAYLRIVNGQRHGLNVPTHAASRPQDGSQVESSKLEFHRYGETYFLESVWVGGNASGRELYVSREEKEFLKQRAEMEMAVVSLGK